MDYQNYQDYSTVQTSDSRVSWVMRRVYLKMFLGLLSTALVALWTASSPAIAQLVLGGGASYWILAIVEIGLVIWISAGINKMSSTTATLLFFLFAIVNGFTLSVIFFAYAAAAIAKAFFITAGTFAAMSIYGFTTKADLTKFGSFLMFALFGLIIASVVNIFLKSSQLDWIISLVGVFLFLGLTAWDTQSAKRMAMAAPDEMLGKVATISALSLYLDFINLFLYLLRIFGNRD